MACILEQHNNYMRLTLFFIDTTKMKQYESTAKEQLQLTALKKMVRSVILRNSRK